MTEVSRAPVATLRAGNLLEALNLGEKGVQVKARGASARGRRRSRERQGFQVAGATRPLLACFHRQSSDVRTNDRKGDAKMLKIDLLEARVLNRRPRFPLGVAAVSENPPHRPNPSLRAARARPLGRGDVFDEDKSAAGPQHAQDFSER